MGKRDKRFAVFLFSRMFSPVFFFLGFTQKIFKKILVLRICNLENFENPRKNQISLSKSFQKSKELAEKRSKMLKFSACGGLLLQKQHKHALLNQNGAQKILRMKIFQVLEKPKNKHWMGSQYHNPKISRFAIWYQ